MWKLKAAIYARCASVQSVFNSTKKQILSCNEFAKKKGWLLEPGDIYVDCGNSGINMEDRPALNSLLKIAKLRPAKFSCVMIDDIARLSRTLKHVLLIADELSSSGVFLYFVIEGLDSREKSFHQMLIKKNVDKHPL